MDGDEDPLLWDVAEMVVSGGVGSTSAVQRRFKLGYARAGRIMDMLYDRGVVGPPQGAKPRDVLVSLEELEQMRFGSHADSGGDDLWES